MQGTVRRKKMRKKKWDTSESQVDQERYKGAKKEVEKAVAEAKNRAWDELHGELEVPEVPEVPEGAKKLFKLTKKRDKVSKD